MGELVYRPLGALLVARRALVALGALAGVVVWLSVVRETATEPTPPHWLAVLGVPTCLGVAAWWLFQLPPGVVFRVAAAGADPAPQRTQRCLASAYFDCSHRTEWRLLARSSLTPVDDGSLVVTSPPPILAAADDARAAFPTRGQPTAAQLREGNLPRHPEWVYQPQTMVGGPSRLVYHSAAEYADAVGCVMVARTRFRDVAAGWQYSGLTRWPAIRVQYYAADGAVAVAYLAFADRAQRGWVLARLVGRPVAPTV